MPVCQVFINGTFFCFSIFFVFLFFWYYQGAYLLGFHQGNDFFFQDFLQFLDFFQDILQFLNFFQDIKYVHGSSETRSAVEPLQVESVDRLLEHFSFGCWKLVGTRSIHCSDDVRAKPVRFELPFLSSLLLILGVFSQDEVTQFEATRLYFLFITSWHPLLIGSKMVTSHLPTFIQ